MTKTVVIVLGMQAHDSRVIVDGHDLTNMVRGVEVSAFVGELTKITLHLIGRVELEADVANVVIEHPPDA
jgi:hypothetical protein